MSEEVARHESVAILTEIVNVYAKTLEAERMWQAASAVRNLGLTAATAIMKRDVSWLPPSQPGS